MFSAATNSLAPDFSNLTTEISKSVNYIRSKATDVHFNTPDVAQNDAFNNFSLHGYAVSYLEPQALFSIHKFVSETEQGEKLNRQSQHKSIFNEDEKNTSDIDKTKKATGFAEELSTTADFSSLRYGISAYQTTIPRNDSPFIIPEHETVSGIYATGAYTYVADINSKPQVLIDFMHEFNRSYDYII